MAPKRGEPDTESSRSDRPRDGATREESQDGPAKLGDSPVDRWIQHALRQIYDPILSEPIPNDMLDLIENDRSRKPKDSRPAPAAEDD